MSNLEKRTGKIITFYSYKGGVGRSMALANIAVLLAQWKYKVLIVDWDLEAPGLENFFKEHMSIADTRKKVGLIDILISESEVTKKVNWKECLVPVFINNSRDFSPLDLITAGSVDDDYYKKVRSFDFNNFYEKHRGGDKIESLRTEWIAEYDFVLIDSRTGVTDIGGICTVQLPDILVVLFTPTEQSLQGVKGVALRAMAAQRKLPYDRINLLTLPIPTRIDNTEFKLTKEWFELFETELKDIYSNWMTETYRISLKDFLLNSKIPYISYFSFGEKLPVLEEGVQNPTGMGFSYESVAALLATRLNNVDLLINNRAELVHAAQNDLEINNSGTDTSPLKLLKVTYLKGLRKIISVRINIVFVMAMLAVASLFGFYMINQALEKKDLQLQLKDQQMRSIMDSLQFKNKIDSSISSATINGSTPGEVALQNAIRELSIGAKSTDTYKPTGQYVKKYNGIVGLDEGYPWAATFVSWCYNKDSLYFKPNGSITLLESYFNANAKTFELFMEVPQPGDIYFYTWKNERAIGIVQSFDGIELYGIEGNSNEDPKERNYKVARVNFSKDELKKLNFNFARPVGDIYGSNPKR